VSETLSKSVVKSRRHVSNQVNANPNQRFSEQSDCHWDNLIGRLTVSVVRTANMNFENPTQPPTAYKYSDPSITNDNRGISRSIIHHSEVKKTCDGWIDWCEPVVSKKQRQCMCVSTRIWGDPWELGRQRLWAAVRQLTAGRQNITTPIDGITVTAESLNDQ